MHICHTPQARARARVRRQKTKKSKAKSQKTKQKKKNQNQIVSLLPPTTTITITISITITTYYFASLFLLPASKSCFQGMFPSQAESGKEVGKCRLLLDANDGRVEGCKGCRGPTERDRDRPRTRTEPERGRRGEPERRTRTQSWLAPLQGSGGSGISTLYFIVHGAFLPLASYFASSISISALPALLSPKRSLRSR